MGTARDADSGIKRGCHMSGTTEEEKGQTDSRKRESKGKKSIQGGGKTMFRKPGGEDKIEKLVAQESAPLQERGGAKKRGEGRQGNAVEK